MARVLGPEKAKGSCRVAPWPSPSPSPGSSLPGEGMGYMHLASQGGKGDTHQFNNHQTCVWQDPAPSRLSPLPSVQSLLPVLKPASQAGGEKESTAPTSCCVSLCGSLCAASWTADEGRGAPQPPATCAGLRLWGASRPRPCPGPPQSPFPWGGSSLLGPVSNCCCF